MLFLLKTDDVDIINRLYNEAYKLKLETVGNYVYFRGIIELSNICDKNCYYCGIRKDNENVNRYFMSDEDILSSAEWAYKMNYGSIVLQAGERTDATFVDKIEELITKIMEMSNHSMGITLSLGEQSFDTLKRWRKAGANRYLLRIETSNQELYTSLHPDDHDYQARLQCLQDLRDNDFQVGTGVLIGPPFQTLDDLVNDIMLYKKMDIDMIGMGPFIPHPETPFADIITDYDKDKYLTLGIKMIALTRLYLKDVNIASTTALQALNNVGREHGLKAGANIIMPVITDSKYRKEYLLYKDKPCLDENASICRDNLESSIESLGEKVIYGKRGDSPHYTKRKKNG